MPELKSRRTRAAPPPPPPPRVGTTFAAAPSGTSSSTFYNTGTTQSSTTTSRGAPPPRRTTPAVSSSASTSTTSSSRPPAPSYQPYSASALSTSTAGSSYYGAPAPFAPPAESSVAAPASNDGWYSAPAPAANEWYSAPPQQQQQPAIMNPSSFVPDRVSPNSSELAGAMDGSTFFSGASTTVQPSAMNQTPIFEDEPPLLEELGINVEHIFIKTRAVVLPFSRFGHNEQNVMHDSDDDLAGPLALALLLGGELMLTGKLQFSYIYGFGLFGCLAMTLVLNLMSPTDAVSVWTVASILGYALVPVNLLAFLKIFVVNLGKLETIGRILAVLTIAWCTVASTRLLEQKCGMRDQRYLVAYPIGLLYSAFVMITIF